MPGLFVIHTRLPKPRVSSQCDVALPKDHTLCTSVSFLLFCHLHFPNFSAWKTSLPFVCLIKYCSSFRTQLSHPVLHKAFLGSSNLGASFPMVLLHPVHVSLALCFASYGFWRKDWGLLEALGMGTEVFPCVHVINILLAHGVCLINSC